MRANAIVSILTNRTESWIETDINLISHADIISPSEPTNSITHTWVSFHCDDRLNSPTADNFMVLHVLLSSWPLVQFSETGGLYTTVKISAVGELAAIVGPPITTLPEIDQHHSIRNQYKHHRLVWTCCHHESSVCRLPQGAKVTKISLFQCIRKVTPTRSKNISNTTTSVVCKSLCGNLYWKTQMGFILNVKWYRKTTNKWRKIDPSSLLLEW